MERIYHPYWLWEEVDHNMWGDVSNRKAALKKAITFTGDHKLYGRFMLRVVREWRYSCENALTDSSLNKKAWVGHAAAALAHGLPESITREAWGYLSHEQRVLANNEADRAIASWKKSREAGRDLQVDMGEALLSRRDTGLRAGEISARG